MLFCPGWISTCATNVLEHQNPSLNSTLKKYSLKEGLGNDYIRSTTGNTFSIKFLDNIRPLPTIRYREVKIAAQIGPGWVE